jgi:hypothetical protein
MLTVTKTALDRLSGKLSHKEVPEGMAPRFTRRDGGWALRLDHEPTGDVAFTARGAAKAALSVFVSTRRGEGNREHRSKLGSNSIGSKGVAVWNSRYGDGALCRAAGSGLRVLEVGILVGRIGPTGICVYSRGPWTRDRLPPSVQASFVQDRSPRVRDAPRCALTERQNR